MSESVDRYTKRSSGLQRWNVVAVALIVAYLATILYGSAIPGAGSMRLSFIVVALFLPVLLLYLWILYSAVFP